MRYSITYSNPNILTHQFFAIVSTETGWTICLAGRSGLGTSYCTSISQRFRTRKLAKEWRNTYLAKSPYDYWIAAEGKYTISESGKLIPCRLTEKAIETGKLCHLGA